MEDWQRERREGVDWEYLMAAMKEKEEARGAHFVSLANLMGQFFSILAKHVIDGLGEEQGGILLKEVVEDFAVQRGKRMASKAAAQGRAPAFKNFMIFTDMDSSKVTSGMTPNIVDGDFHLETRHCDFYEGAKEAGLPEYAYHYCQYIDQAIIRGFNPDIDLEVTQNLSAGDEACYFIYRLKDGE